MIFKKPLVVGIIIGLAAGYGGGYLYFQNHYADIVADWQLKTVVVFNQDLPAGTILDLEMVVSMDSPNHFTPEHHVNKQQMMNLIGRKLAFPVERGSIFLFSMLAPEKPGTGKAERSP